MKYKSGGDFMKKNNLYKLSGIMLMLGGLLYIVIQFIHPIDELASVSTPLYIGVAIMTSVMSSLIFLGILGLYIKHMEYTGVLGGISIVIFGLFWIISMIFSFNEAFVLPLIEDSSTEFVIGMTGLFNSVEVSANLGIFPSLAIIAGLMYVLGGATLGISLYQSKHFPRNRAVLLCISSIITLASGLIPHPLDRGLAIPMGIALILSGYTLIKEQQTVFDTL